MHLIDKRKRPVRSINQQESGNVCHWFVSYSYTVRVIDDARLNQCSNYNFI